MAKPDLLEANTKLKGSESAMRMVGPGPAMRVSLRRGIAEGVRVVMADPLLRVLMAYGAAANISLAGIQAVEMVFLIRNVRVAAGTVGILFALSSIGGLTGALCAGVIACRFGTARGALLCYSCAAPFTLLIPMTSLGAGLGFNVVGGWVRVGELCDLELDCVHEVADIGAWLKVPLGKLNSERMVPLDAETVALIDRITATRSPGRPLPHPKTGRPTEFLLTHYGRRISAETLRDELARAAERAALPKATPHQLRHSWATALVNAGCSLQALMVMLGHTSAAMSLRYARLFDATVRADYERALVQVKSRLGDMPEPRKTLPLTTISAGADWKDAPLVKARLAGGYCLRTAAQGSCAYANICEHCPNFRLDAAFLPVLAAQRADTELCSPPAGPPRLAHEPD
ncbi:tyrosine-type recombinase/integrase [Nocardia sp. NPDC060256]|uniref:tyrosine-type recombinase/integrase n=1 Tax=unclassified Nocardia TaxID=2637762 RepID=UPI00366448B2